MMLLPLTGPAGAVCPPPGQDSRAGPQPLPPSHGGGANIWPQVARLLFILAATCCFAAFGLENAAADGTAVALSSDRAVAGTAVLATFTTPQAAGAGPRCGGVAEFTVDGEAIGGVPLNETAGALCQARLRWIPPPVMPAGPHSVCGWVLLAGTTDQRTACATVTLSAPVRPSPSPSQPTPPRTSPTSPDPSGLAAASTSEHPSLWLVACAVLAVVLAVIATAIMNPRRPARSRRRVTRPPQNRRPGGPPL